MFVSEEPPNCFTFSRKRVCFPGERGNLNFIPTQTIMSDGLMAFLRSYFIRHRNVGHKLTTIASVLNGKSSNI